MAVHGDAFVYRSKRGIALIDGGGSSAKLGKKLAQELPAVEHLDVVVCTHADQDHANGLKSVIADWRTARRGQVSIGEFWLPGRWMDVVKRGVKDPKSLMSDLIHALDEGKLDETRLLLWTDTDEGDDNGDIPRRLARLFSTSGSSIEFDHVSRNANEPIEVENQALAEGDTQSSFSKPHPSEGEFNQDFQEPFEPDWLRAIRERKASVIDERDATHIFQSTRRRVVYRMGHHPHLRARNLPKTVGTSDATGRYCLALIDAAEAIVSIAKQAIVEGVPIRWFDQELYADTLRARGGQPNFLLPMNSVELRSTPTAVALPVLYYLSLSKANRESLAFYAPAETGCHGVVFCADTRLGTGRGGKTPFQVYPSMAKSDQIGTAPHHGAESAARAYSFATRFGITHWVCAANGRTKPGRSFQKIAKNQRCCTACPLKVGPFSTIKLSLSSNAFALPTTCSCP
nr:MBL fold metallo-hydrolase [Ruegeria atlantica]